MQQVEPPLGEPGSPVVDVITNQILAAYADETPPRSNDMQITPLKSRVALNDPYAIPAMDPRTFCGFGFFHPRVSTCYLLLCNLEDSII